jgi:hypothetical protein
MSTLIPNLFEKYGGASALKPTLVEFTKGLLVNPSIRRCLGDLSNEQIVEHNFAMFALVLGKPDVEHDFSIVREVLVRNRITQHAYEEIIRLLRHVLLEAGFVSRDASIAINMLDMHCETIIGISPTRKVTSPFAGVDRRRKDRSPPPG